MNSWKYKMVKLNEADILPFSLLLLADETMAAISKYIYQSMVYVVRENDKEDPVAVIVLHENTDIEIEIKNIAVAESHQGCGIGSWLIAEIKKNAASPALQRIIAGTPATALQQIRFYEKNGFTKYAVKKDYFIENYTMPIIEDGVMLRDMQMLEIKL